MEWFNLYGLIIVIVILIPNIIYAIKTKGKSEGKYKGKMEIIEQIGRYGSMAFMIFNIPYTYFGWWAENTYKIYLIIDFELVILYCLLWIILWNKESMFKALSLSIIPSLIFVSSAVLIRSIPLFIFAVMFAFAHIYMSYQNAKPGE